MRVQLSAAARLPGGARIDGETKAYFYDLTPVLARVDSGSLPNPERLRLVERHVRAIAGSDTVLFADGGFYLVIRSCTGPAAFGLANYINTSLLMLLFGTESLTEEQRVTMFTLVDTEEVPTTLAGQGAPRDRFDANWDPNVDGREEDAGSALAQLASAGVYPEQNVELAFFPVHDLSRRAVSALFCAPTFAGAIFGHQAFQSLNQAELPYIDRAILLHSMAFASRLAAAGIVMAVGAPVSFETLAWSKSRQIYQWALRSANVAEQPQLILKIEDVPPGTPAERIAQAVSSLRPFARHIFVHLPNDHIELGMNGRMGASGLVLSLQRRAALPEVLADSKYLSRMAVAQGAMSCIDHVESDEALNVVRTTGIRFAVGNVFGAETVRGSAPLDEVKGTLARIEQANTDHLRVAS